MMTLWCIYQSPLMLGAELTKLDEETLSLLCNQKVLALFELPAGQAKEIIRDDTVIVWKTGDYAAIFNVSGFDCMVNISELLEIQEKNLQMTYGQEKKSKQIKRQQFLHMAAFFWKFSIKKASLLMRLAFLLS